MKRRRFITCGSILAMVLALATVGYLIWLGFMYVRDERIVNIGGVIQPKPLQFEWKGDPDSVTIGGIRKRVFVLWELTLRCNACSKKHPHEIDCEGNPIVEVSWFTWGSGPSSYGPVTYSSLGWGRRHNGLIGFPSWLPIPVLAVYPALYFLVVGIRRFRRRGKNLCKHCDYDLTGNESGVCPECGTAIAQETPT